MATIDVLGEEITSADEAAAIARAVPRRARADRRRGARLERLGQADGARARARPRPLPREPRGGRRATPRERGSFVRIDMEDSSTTDATLALYRELRAAGYENVGVVLQSRLRRTLDDVAGPRQRPALQGHLPRAARRSRSRTPTRCARASCAASRRCSTQGSYVGDRDARRAADRRGAAPDRASAALGRDRVRVPDAARRAAGARRRARARRATACASTSRSGRTGTSTRCAA